MSSIHKENIMSKNPFYIRSIRKPKMRLTFATFNDINDERPGVIWLSESNRDRIYKQIVSRAAYAWTKASSISKIESMIGHSVDMEWADAHSVVQESKKQHLSGDPQLVFVPTKSELKYISSNMHQLHAPTELNKLRNCDCNKCIKLLQLINNNINELAKSTNSEDQHAYEINIYLTNDLSSKIYLVVPIIITQKRSEVKPMSTVVH